MKRYITITILIFALLLPSTAMAQDNFAEQIAELFSRIEAIEAKLTTPEYSNDAPPVTSVTPIFSGQGNTYTMPFTVSSYPWRIEWQTEMLVSGGVNFDLELFDATKTTMNRVKGFGSYVSGNQTGETVAYVLPGQYYFYVNTGYFVKWNIQVTD